MSVYHDPDVPIEVILGENFTISLESIPSTGYMWKEEYDSTMIELLKPEEFVSRSSAIGGGGEEILEFQAKRVGETQIKMKHQREWESAARETKIFRVHIARPG